MANTITDDRFALWLLLGTSIGTNVGLLFDHLLIGVVAGFVLGLVAGALLARKPAPPIPERREPTVGPPH